MNNSTRTSWTTVPEHQQHVLCCCQEHLNMLVRNASPRGPMSFHRFCLCFCMSEVISSFRSLRAGSQVFALLMLFLWVILHTMYSGKTLQLICILPFGMRGIGRIRNLLTFDATAQLIHALITSRLDFCNSILYNLPNKQIERLQRIQNQAARMLKRIPRRNHITPVLRELHWLRIHDRIILKI